MSCTRLSNPKRCMCPARCQRAVRRDGVVFRYVGSRDSSEVPHNTTPPPARSVNLTRVAPQKRLSRRLKITVFQDVTWRDVLQVDRDVLFLETPVSCILHILGKTRVHHLVQNRPPLVPVLSYTSSVHATPSGFCKMRFNVILPSTPKSFKWRLSFGFSHHNTSSQQNVLHSQLSTSLLSSYYRGEWTLRNVGTLPDYTALHSSRQ
jgi:hypothetical protein